MVKLILEKGMDPNILVKKYLDKEKAAKLGKGSELPERILDISPVSLACIKY